MSLKKQEPEDSGPSREFAVKEFETLRREIESAMKDYSWLQKSAVLVTAGVWGWLLSDPGQRAIHMTGGFAWWTPLIFSILAAFKCVSLYCRSRANADYIKKIENFLYDNPNAHHYGLTGWEHRNLGRRGWLLLAADWLFWGFMATATTLGAWLLSHSVK